jgi:hypothetical protein
MQSRLILAACMISLIAGCSLAPKMPVMPSSERTLTAATQTTIPAGTAFTTAGGAVGVTTEPVTVTLPEGTKIDGGWGAVMWWLFAVAAIFAAWKIIERIIKRKRTK